MTQLFTKFPNLEKKEGLIHWVTAGGSAFCTLTDGNQAFMSARMVSSLGVGEGDAILAYVLPNYHDKQSTCKYRTVRAERMEDQGPSTESPAPVDEPQPSEEEIESTLPDRILDALKDGDLYTTKELSDYLMVGMIEVRNACMSLHRAEKIARADVFRKLEQGRATVTLWAIDVGSFVLV